MSISSDSRRMKRRKEVSSPQDAQHRRSGVVDCVMDNLDVVCVIRNGVDDAYVGVDDLEGEGDESFWIPGSLARHMGYPIHLNNSDQRYRDTLENHSGRMDLKTVFLLCIFNY